MGRAEAIGGLTWAGPMGGEPGLWGLTWTALQDTGGVICGAEAVGQGGKRQRGGGTGRVISPLLGVGQRASAQALGPLAV